MVRSLFHAHNWTFSRIRTQLEALASAGYDAVQLSPAQKSPPGQAWYLRYQPYDHLEIDGLGDRKELALLSAEARARGIRIVADVVFNHMAVPAGIRRAQWLAADAQRLRGSSAALDQLYASLAWFPHLTRADFEPWQDMQGADWDSDKRYESWGAGEWPELRPTANVLRLHGRHLEILYDCGVRGFRFDAVKHMRAPHVAEYVRAIRAFPEACWCYGEVFSDDPAMHAEYQDLFPTTDFPFIQLLRAALAAEKPFHLEPKTAFLSPTSIRFGNNHDLACNPKDLVAGLLFATPEHTKLANCLSLVLHGGTALVFAEDHEQDALLRSCVAFRQATGGISGPVEISNPKPHSWRLAATHADLILDLGQNKLDDHRRRT